MTKTRPAKGRSVTPARKAGRRRDYPTLLKAIEHTNTQMVSRAAALVNQALVVRNWLIGAYLVEYEQGGRDRASYGVRLHATLAQDLAARSVGGCGERMLQQMATLYRTYPQIGTAIPQPAVAELTIATQVTRRSNSATTGDGIGPAPLTVDRLLSLSWTHLLDLIRIDDPWKRAFYENECLAGHWSKRQLQRQIESLLYERTGLSTRKRAVLARAGRQAREATRDTIADLIRDPYVLEFTGLAERPAYSEGDLETALLDHVQRFLMELGTGFCFEARQFRITSNNKHDRVDLVFYRRRVRCHVLVDLKIRAFRHTDAGQMNFYLNWFKAHMMGKGDNPPVGIVLCSGKEHTEVEFATGGMDNRLFVSRYLTALPSARQLQVLVDADRARRHQDLRDPRRRKGR